MNRKLVCKGQMGSDATTPCLNNLFELFELVEMVEVVEMVEMVL